MNKIRRNQLNEAMKLLYQAQEIIEACKDEEEDAFDNLPESIQSSERGETMEDYITYMEDALGSIADAIDSADEVFC